MSNDPRSARPKDYADDLSFPSDLADEVEQLYASLYDEDVPTPPFENVRIAMRVPAGCEGAWKQDPTWQVHRCDLTSRRFAAPDGAPVPMLCFDRPAVSEEGGTATHRLKVHPDLLDDPASLGEEIVSRLEARIFDEALNLLWDAQKLTTVLELEEAPSMGDSPYPEDERRKRRGYVAIESARPAD